MDKPTLKALRGSINKWIKIVRGTGVDYGEANCPLCKMFNTFGNDCVGCPVFQKTKKPYCMGTPFAGWVRLNVDRVENERHAKWARKELAFLQSLLPSAVLPSEER